MIQQAIRIIRVIVGNTAAITRVQIEEHVDQVLQMPIFNAIDREDLIREVESIYSIRVEDFRIIEGPDRKRPWLNSKRAEISWGFWTRYRMYLQDEKGFAPDTLSKLDRLTDRVLDGLFDPREDIQIDKRGMVVGQVQSGKTSNYTGLICKAADAGFKLIVVLSGIHENLRSQTQLRLDEGFLGFDTRNSRAFNTSVLRIGVGKYGSENCIAHSITSSEHRADFNTSRFNSLGINFDTPDPILIVTKKHAGILENLVRWLSLQTHGTGIIHSKSLLLIDDEADNASINTNRSDHDPTTINRRIREMLAIFRKSAYVGYTATPFANIFIPLEEDNLFPRDFVVNIPPPSNYIGPERVFGFRMEEEEDTLDSVLPIVNRIDDYSLFVPDKHRREDQLPTSIPASLKSAIKCFILSCAIRRLRGQTNVHNSMLVHVSRFQRWQDHIREMIQNNLDFYRRGIDQMDIDILEEFRKAFEEDTMGYRSYRTVSSQIIHSSLAQIDPYVQVHSWEDVLFHLHEAVSRIEVRAIHGGSREALDYYDYKDGLSVIAVGGNKLSRGLTLEGLSVSYYLRSSRMYDTLMQMGRWFGYRPGYVDLCRLFTSRELNEWFCHITHASEELREEFDYMSDVAGSTPEQYALKVRTHPGVLQVSATNKLRSAVTVQLTWAGRLVESYELRKDVDMMTSNLNAVRDLFSDLGPFEKIVNNNYLWYDIDANQIIGFLNSIRTLENLKAYDPQNLVKFITMQLPNNELTSWRVALMSKRESSKYIDLQIHDTVCQVGCFLRREDESNSDNNIYYLKKSHLISPKDEFIDLAEDDYERAMQLTRELRIRQNKEGEPTYPKGELVRNEVRSPQNPLLLIYLLEPEGANLPSEYVPFVGYAISFPGSNHNVWVAYAINEQLLDRFNYDLEDDEREED